MFEVEVRNVAGEPAAIGNAGPHTLVVDRPADAGGRGLGVELLSRSRAAIAEIPSSLRRGTAVRPSGARVHAAGR